MSGKNYSAYPFSGIPSFLRAPIATKENKLAESDYTIGIIGVPFDEGCPFVPGSRFCARAMREQSLRFSERGYYDHQDKKTYLGDELARKKMVDFGDVNIIPTDVEGSFERITEAAKKVIDKDALLIAMGGDHAITYPVVRAFKGKPIHVLHLDSHTDFLPIQPNFKNTNTHPFTHISKMEHVKSLTQVGYRSIRDFTGLDSAAQGNRVIGMEEFRELGPKGIANILPEGEPCYVSIDIDVLDSSLVPGCVSAEPNGMMYAELRDILAEVAKHNQIVGFDMVEVSPDLDVGTNITSYLATQIVVEFLGKICDQPYWKKRYDE
ncbi:arginase family protein [Abyssisolibacter fermentans]|uniref:arginase family protein n=1 Tax=Abyssisolibacter fermentans TaxID=1766203 RepID=UPI00082FBCB5|nr:arginase family protein [Abyssisolibacter fermentans]